MLTVSSAGGCPGSFHIDLLSSHRQDVSGFVFLVIGFVVYSLAVVLAVASYGDVSFVRKQRSRAIARVAPYLVASVPALYFAIRSGDWLNLLVEVAIYLALTWGIVWAVRKQWYR